MKNLFLMLALCSTAALAAPPAELDARIDCGETRFFSPMSLNIALTTSKFDSFGAVTWKSSMFSARITPAGRLLTVRIEPAGSA